jgi:Tol biopolymer transport system component
VSPSCPPSPPRRPTHAAIALAILAAASSACGSSSDNRAKEPTGQIPSATTTAKPEWIPFQIRAGKAVVDDPREKHLKDIRQLTFGGENAEAYWSPDGRKLIMQSTREGSPCDQIYTLDLGTGETKLVSTGKGKTTCSYFIYPKGERILYGSTHGNAPECPPKPDRSLGYAWPLDEMDIYTANPDGTDLKPLITGKGYDAEATVAFDGSRMVFTSVRDGDLELYTSKVDGTDIKRITNTPGYDGGAFFSPDATKIIWRAGRPEGAALEEYRTLLAKGVVKPNQVEIIVSGAEGQNARFITKNGKANFGPSFLPDSRRVIFSSNVDSTAPRGKAPNFELYVIDTEGPVTADGVPALERITYYDEFDGFPMFSPDGEHVVFASNRFGAKPGETNVFVAKWVN